MTSYIMSSAELLRLGGEVEAQGALASESSIRRVVDAARAAGIRSVALQVLADDREPEVARIRAFGMVTVALGAVLPPAPTAQDVTLIA